jgi:hypothetical protein
MGASQIGERGPSNQETFDSIARAVEEGRKHVLAIVVGTSKMPGAIILSKSTVCLTYVFPPQC